MGERPRSARRPRSRGVLLALALAGLGAAAQASDGRFELNQATVLAAGGFPYGITQSGSYVLTSDLAVPDGTTGLRIGANEVTIDFNGFAIRSGHVCGSGCSAGSGIGVEAIGVGSGPARTTTLHDGIVAGFAGHCLDLGPGARVERLVVRDCGGSGVRAAEHAVVERSRISNAGGYGLDFLAAALFSDNVITQIDQGGGTGFVSGGSSAGSNLCDESQCRAPDPLPPARRRYYLTSTTHQGNHGGNVCQPGFHMASVFELMDPSSLRYDSTLGVPGFGEGPPEAGGTGWVYGSISRCATASDWDSSSGAQSGLVLLLNASSTGVPQLSTGLSSCSALLVHVWCVED